MKKLFVVSLILVAVSLSLSCIGGDTLTTEMERSDQALEKYDYDLELTEGNVVYGSLHSCSLWEGEECLNPLFIGIGFYHLEGSEWVFDGYVTMDELVLWTLPVERYISFMPATQNITEVEKDRCLYPLDNGPNGEYAKHGLEMVVKVNVKAQSLLVRLPATYSEVVFTGQFGQDFDLFEMTQDYQWVPKGGSVIDARGLTCTGALGSYEVIIIGNSEPNIIYAPLYCDNYINGSGDNDTINGGLLDDILIGGEGNDWIVDLSSGTVLAIGGPGNDRIDLANVQFPKVSYAYGGTFLGYGQPDDFVNCDSVQSNCGNFNDNPPIGVYNNCSNIPGGGNCP